MNKQIYWIAGVCVVIVLIIVGINSRSKNPTIAQTNTEPTNSQATSPPSIAPPLDRASERITKKFFGTYVTPKNSPVTPEKFTGFHTGLDFETFPEEKDADIPVKAICTGKLLSARIASGYGGVAIQACTINNQAVTVVYGHLRLSSVTTKVGTELKTGERLALLGTGYSAETDGERKHLHLSIHIGTAQNIKGYVQTKLELSGWLDPKVILGL